MRDIFDGDAELRRHFAAEIDRHAGITRFRFGRPECAAGRADRDRDPQLAGRRNLVLQRIGAGRRGHHDC
jgi:hypothetical protein